MQDISTQGGGYDIYSVEWNRLGDLAESGGIANSTTTSPPHRPNGTTRRTAMWRRAGRIAAQPVSRSTYGVSLDGDFQSWFYRQRPLRRPAEQAAFQERFGYPLAPPRTRAQHADVAALFHRPDQGPLRPPRTFGTRAGGYTTGTSAT
jgi:multiple sugar transport system substrate-binding protein